MSSSEYLFLESECSFTQYVSSSPKTKYLYLRLLFLKMKAIADRLKTVSWSNDSHQTGVVQPVYGSQQQRTIFW